MNVGRPKSNDYPDYMSPDGDRGGFVVRNPITGKKKRFAPAEEDKARATAKMLKKWVDKERQAQALDAGKALIGGVVERFRTNRMQFMPWDKGTRYAIECKLNRIQRELGKRPIERTDCIFLEDWLTVFCKTADQWNKWRYVFVLVYAYAVSRKDITTNEGEKLLERSTSKKLEANQKIRQPLDIQGFLAIYEKAPSFLEIAMDQSLVTLLARTEICNVQQAHYRDGWLYVIRDKTSAQSDMAFIKIAITQQIEEIRRRSYLDALASPYLIHRKPANDRREWIENKPHWSFVNPPYLTKAFAAARQAAGIYEHLDPLERPSFHEIRGLGSRIMLANGIDAKVIQFLMTHSDPKTTEIYLEGGAAALKDSDYIPVSAPLSLKQMLGTRGQI